MSGSSPLSLSSLFGDKPLVYSPSPTSAQPLSSLSLFRFFLVLSCGLGLYLTRVEAFCWATIAREAREALTMDNLTRRK